MQRDTEREMRDSMLLTLYMNLACCYLNLSHHQEARRMVELGKKIAPTNSIVLFRSVLCATSNISSGAKELEDALEEMNTAIENKKSEKLFQH